MKTILRKVDRGYMHGKQWEYRLSILGKQIVPHGYFASLSEVIIQTWFYLTHPRKWR